jgi:intracellular multiplication protein IcmK
MKQRFNNIPQPSATAYRRSLVRRLLQWSAITVLIVPMGVYAADTLPIGNKIPLNKMLEKSFNESPSATGSSGNLASTASAANSSSNISQAVKDQAYKSVQNEAFSKLLRSSAPMRPDEIRQLHSVIQNSKQVVANPSKNPAKGTSNTIIVDVTPGASAPVVRLARGYVTAVRFLDATGQPWPIQAYDIGNGSLFDVHWDQKGSTLFMEAKTDYQKSNMMVQLRGLSAPVMLNLIPGQSAMDYRDDLRINAMGPTALAESDMSIPDAVDQTLSTVLNGIQPKKTKQVGTSLMGTTAFEANDKSSLFLRLPSSMTLLSPAWVSRLSSDDGVQAYKVPLASTIVVMQRGKITQFTVAGL